MWRKLMPALGLLCASGFWSPALAQIEPGFEISGYVGSFRGSGGTVQILDQRRTRDIRTELEKDDAGIGVGAAYNANRVLGIEGAFIGATNNHVARFRDLASEVAVTENTELIFIQGNGVFHLLPGRIAPFVTVGAGILGTIEKTSFAWNYGAGAKLFLTPRLAGRLEVRQFRANLTDVLEQMVLGRGGSLVGIPESYTDQLKFTELSAGISIFF